MSRSIMQLIYNIKKDWCIKSIAALLHPKRYYGDCDVIVNTLYCFIVH